MRCRYDSRSVPSDKQDKSDLIVSEEIITGLKRHLLERLKPCHGKDFLSEISELLDELVIESSYMGVMCKQNHQEAFIVKAITKRRLK